MMLSCSVPNIGIPFHFCRLWSWRGIPDRHAVVVVPDWVGVKAHNSFGDPETLRRGKTLPGCSCLW